MKDIHLDDFSDWYTIAIELLERRAEILQLRTEIRELREKYEAELK